MTALDWVLVVVWVGIALSGFWKGAVRLVFGGGGLLIGIWLAVVAGASLALELGRWIQPAWGAAILGRLLPLVVCVLVGFLAGWGLERTLEALRLGWLNRVAGAALAGAVAAVLLAVLLITTAGLSPLWSEVCARSLIAPRLMALGAGAVDAQAPAEEPTAVEEASSGR